MFMIFFGRYIDEFLNRCF